MQFDRNFGSGQTCRSECTMVLLSLCIRTLPQTEHLKLVKGAPIAFQRIPPKSQTLLSWLQVVQRVCQVLESAMAESRQDFGIKYKAVSRSKGMRFPKGPGLGRQCPALSKTISEIE